MIRFHCPKCESQMEVDESFAGRAARCPTCGTNMKVPKKGEAPPPPAGTKGPPPRPGAATVKVDGEKVEIQPPIEVMVYVSIAFLAAAVVMLVLVCGVLPSRYAMTGGGFLGILLSVMGTLTALPAYHNIRRSRGRKRGRTPALVGMGAGGALLLISALIFSIGLAREFLGRASCEDNLNRIYKALRGYTAKHDDVLPRELPGLVQEGLLDSSSWLTCEAYPDQIGRQTYSYWGTDAARLGAKIAQLPPELPIVTDGPPYDLHPDRQVRVLQLNGEIILVSMDKWEAYRKAQGDKWNAVLNKIRNPTAPTKPETPAPTTPAPETPATPAPAVPAPGPATPAPTAPAPATPAPAAPAAPAPATEGTK